MKGTILKDKGGIKIMIKRIGLDIDGTLMDTMSLYLDIYNSKNNTNFMKKDIYKFDFGRILKDNNFMQYFELIDCSKAQLTDIHIPSVVNYWKSKGYLVDLITNTSVKTLTPKCKRLKQLGVMFDGVIRTDGCKGEFAENFNFIVDDSPKNLDDIVKHGGRAICFNQPWNQEWKGERVYGFNQLINFEKKRYDTK